MDGGEAARHPPFEFENWAIITLGDMGYFQQKRQSRPPDIDAIEPAQRHPKRDEDCFASSDYSGDALCLRVANS